MTREERVAEARRNPSIGDLGLLLDEVTRQELVIRAANRLNDALRECGHALILHRVEGRWAISVLAEDWGAVSEARLGFEFINRPWPALEGKP